MPVVCPCCGSAATLVRELQHDVLARQLETFVRDSGIHACGVGDYRLLRCKRCELEFADPMREPPPAFYEWLTQAPNYYPARRWEWDECQRLLAERAFQGPMRLIDVGCGSGGFIAQLRALAHVHAIGLDVSQASVEQCRSAGLEAIQGSLQDVAPRFPNGVDVVTMWHVVEHVADPVGVLRQAQCLLASGGVIWFSVPMSPPSYEASWTDPLNQPPHHLTRWNIASLRTLSQKLGMTLDLIVPPADSLLKRVVRAILLQCVSPFANATRQEKLWRMAAFLCAHPLRLPIETWRQLTRTRLAGKVLPDVVLVSLALKSAESPENR